MAISHVLFDLGRVLLDWEPERLYEKIFEDPAERSWFLENVCTMAWHTRHDAGETFAQTRDPLIAQYPEHETAIRAWSERWMEMFDGYVDGVPELMDALAARQVALFALTNMSSETWPWHLAAFDKLHMFKDVVVSGDIGMVKPDPEIYHHALARMGGIDPQRVFFIDDSLANIEAAAQIGFHTHHFKGAAGLQAALIAHGLLL